MLRLRLICASRETIPPHHVGSHRRANEVKVALSRRSRTKLGSDAGRNPWSGAIECFDLAAQNAGVNPPLTRPPRLRSRACRICRLSPLGEFCATRPTARSWPAPSAKRFWSEHYAARSSSISTPCSRRPTSLPGIDDRADAVCIAFGAPMRTAEIRTRL